MNVMDLTKIFLYFEETDYCKRAKKNGYKSYQINVIKVKHNVGSSVDYKNEEEEKNIKTSKLAFHLV